MPPTGERGAVGGNAGGSLLFARDQPKSATCLNVGIRRKPSEYSTENAAHLAEVQREAIVRGNVMKLYGLT